MTGGTFGYGIADINFEHMTTTLATYNIIPEMDTASFYGK
jgi:hypothetical protein